MLFFLIFFLIANPLFSDHFNIYLESGIYNDHFSFKLKKNKDNVFFEIFDKIKYKNSSPQLRLGTSYTVSNFTFMANGSLLLESPASTHLSLSYREDYTSPSFAKNHKGGKMSGYDYSLAFGFVASLHKGFIITYLFGYAEDCYHFSHHPGSLKNTLHFEKEQEQDTKVAHLSCSACWKGPWVGLKLNSKILQTVNFIIEAEYHWNNQLRADGNCTVIERLSDGYSFDSKIKSNARGRIPGIKLQTVLMKEICSHWNIFLHGYYQCLITQAMKNTSKHDQIVYKPKSTPISQINFEQQIPSRIKWHAWAILGGASYVF